MFSIGYSLKISRFARNDKFRRLFTKPSGFEAPFKIIADPGLIKTGYDAGFGNSGSMGLGCVALITNAYNNKND